MTRPVLKITNMNKMAFTLQIMDFKISLKRINSLLRTFLLEHDNERFVFLSSKTIEALSGSFSQDQTDLIHRHRSLFINQLSEMCVSLDILLFADNETRTTLVDTITSLRTENWSEEKANTLVDVMASTPIRGNHLRNIREMMSSLNFHIVKYRGVSDFSKKINSIVSKTSNIVKANYLVVLTWCRHVLPDFPQFPPKSDVINKIEIDKFRDIDVTVTKKEKQEISKETTYPDSLLKYEIHFDNHKYTFLDLLEKQSGHRNVPKKKKVSISPQDFLQGVKLPTVRTYIVEKPDDLNGWTNKKIEGYNWIVYKDPNDDTTTALMPTKISPGGPYFLKDMGDENHNENVEAINLSYIMPEILPAVKVSHVQVLSQNQYDVFTDVVMNL